MKKMNIIVIILFIVLSGCMAYMLVNRKAEAGLYTTLIICTVCVMIITELHYPTGFASDLSKTGQAFWFLFTCFLEYIKLKPPSVQTIHALSVLMWSNYLLARLMFGYSDSIVTCFFSASVLFAATLGFPAPLMATIIMILLLVLFIKRKRRFMGINEYINIRYIKFRSIINHLVYKWRTQDINEV